MISEVTPMRDGLGPGLASCGVLLSPAAGLPPAPLPAASRGAFFGLYNAHPARPLFYPLEQAFWQKDFSAEHRETTM